MDIRSKRFNSFVKFIIILLSVIMVAVSTKLISNVVIACISYNLGIENFENKPINKKVSESAELSSRIYGDIDYLERVIKLRNSDEVRKALEKKRDEFVNSAISDFVENQHYFNEEYEDNYYEEDYEGAVYFSDDQYINYDNGFNEPFGFTLSISESDNIRYDIDTEETAKKKINAIYDKFLKTDNFESYAFMDDVLVSDSVHSIVDTKNNLEYDSTDVKADEKEYLSHEYAFVAKDGKVKCSKGLEGLFDTSIDEKTGKSTAFNEDYEYYFYVDPDSTAFNGYTAIIDNAKSSQNVNLLANTVTAGILLLLAVVLAIISFIICGNKDESGKVKRIFLDYIPTDLHLVLTAAAEVGLVILFAYIWDVIVSFAYPFEKVLYVLTYAVAALIWALFIEFVTSTVRVCRSEKKLYKNLLIYQFSKYVIAKPAAYFVKLFKYTPQSVSKLFKRWIVGYALLNVAFIVIIFICAVSDLSFFACYAFLVSLGINIALFVFVVRYAKNLDEIITAAHFRQPPRVDYNKLPNSLKTLVNSINYTNNELSLAVDKAVKDERMRTELITNVSHDLKTPLTSIINYVDLLKACDIQDENAQEYIEVLDDKGKKLKRLIEDLIEASKITSGVINIEPINLDLSELATQAVVEHQQEFSENGLTFVFKGDRKTVNAYADGTKTYRIIENLISNARKYSLKGTRVYADVYETQNFSIFEIKNTSAEPLDIPASELTERFVRGDKSRANEGNGLGLSIAENLCKAQGGHLHITIDGDLFKAQVMLPKTKN